MPKSGMKNAFNYAVNLLHPKPQRFIDIDGRPWFKKTFLDKIDPVYVIGGGIALASVFAASAMAPEGQKLLAIANQLDTAAYYASFGALSTMLYSKTLKERKKLSIYSIDKTGQSMPPANNENLLLKASKMKSFAAAELMAGSAFTIICASMDTIISDLISLKSVTFYSVTLGMPLGKAYGDYVRCKKLINRNYTFCGTPPAELKKAEARSTRRFGVLAPSAA
jgi:hypothetical protein